MYVALRTRGTHAQHSIHKEFQRVNYCLWVIVHPTSQLASLLCVWTRLLDTQCDVIRLLAVDTHTDSHDTNQTIIDDTRQTHTHTHKHMYIHT